MTPVVVITGDTGVSYPEARITATPGMFCDAMVTRNSGSARPMIAGSETLASPTPASPIPH